MEKINRFLVLDGDPIATFISQEVFSHVETGLTTIYLTGITDSLAYLRKNFPIDVFNAEEGIQLLLLGQTLRSLEFLERLKACEDINCDRLYIVVLMRSLRLEEIEIMSEYNIHGYYSELLSTDLVSKIIMDCNSSQSSRLVVV